MERDDAEALRLLGVWWHRACWVAEADRRAPLLEAQRRKAQDRLTVAELLLRQAERERQGFDVLGRRGALAGYDGDNDC